MHLDLGDLCQLIQIRQDAGDFGPGFLGVGFLGQVDGALEHAAELGQDVQSVVDVLGNLNAAASRIGARGVQATDGLTARLPSGASAGVCDEILLTACSAMPPGRWC